MRTEITLAIRGPPSSFGAVPVRTSGAVGQVLARLKDREGSIEYIDTGSDDSEREAMLLIGESTSVGSKPEEIFDDAGNPVLWASVPEHLRYRRKVHYGLNPYFE